MSAKHEYLLQKGRQLQALNAQVEGSKTSSSASFKTTHKQKSELARVRELCPTGTDDDVLLALLAAAKGDQARTEQAISELWENHRGGAGDEWATVEKKGKKKPDTSSYGRGNSTSGGRFGGGRGDRPAYRTTTTTTVTTTSGQPQDGADEDADGNTAGGRGGRGGFSSVRGRGAPAARGGRGAVRGRGGRGAAPRSTGPREAGDADDNTDGDVAAEDAHSNSKDGNKQRKDAPLTKQAETQPAAVAPPPVIPGLTGAWTKKPNLAGLIQPPKPVEQPKPVVAEKPKAPTPAPAPAAPSPASIPVAAPTPVVTAQPTPASPAAKSPVKPAAAAAAALSPKAAPVSSPKKTVAASPVAAKAAEKIASPKAVSPKKLESPSISAWGSLDVSTTTIGDWASATTTTTTTTEKKTVQTPNAWARGSPIIGSEGASTSTPATPVSPKEIPVARQEPLSGGSATSPKYLKLGRWESGVAANLSLQFGSFSLNGVEHTEATSPRGWGAAASSTPSSKAATKASEAPSAWGTQPTASPKKKTTPLSPARATETEERKTSAPPGLSVDSGRVTPKSAQSPRGFAPSAPSPASLPKPDEVKRSTPTRAQGGPFQAAPQAQASSKIGSGSSYASEFSTKSSSIYQSTYGQYAMGLGGAANQTQLSASNTPKGAARASGPAAAAVQSPSHGAQQVQAAQYQAQTQQVQQQKPVQQQTQQTQAQQHQHQAQQGQAHGHQQNVPPHHQAGPPGYHPHYAPPPPPGMAMGYNPYNYANYYQGYGYYQNPQYAQYSPRTQYPPRGSIPYGVEGPMPGFSNPPNVPVGYQDQHLLHQHDYPGAIPQGFGEISNAYLQQPGQHHHHSHQASGPQSHGKGNNQSGSQQQPRSGSGMQGYQNTATASARDHGASAPPVPNPATAATAAAASYGQQQHYGWASYGGQPMGGWGHMMPQGYQQQAQAQQQHQHQGSHQSYRQQYGANSSQTGSASSDASSGNAHAHSQHAWSS